MATWIVTKTNGETKSEPVEADTLTEASILGYEWAGEYLASISMVDEVAEVRASAIEKLVAGQPLTETEAIAIAGSGVST